MDGAAVGYRLDPWWWLVAAVGGLLPGPRRGGAGPLPGYTPFSYAMDLSSPSS